MGPRLEDARAEENQPNPINNDKKWIDYSEAKKGPFGQK